MKFLRYACLEILMLGLVVGCGTRPVADRDAPVGVYTYDQAVQKFGRPDKSTKLDNGDIVAEWKTGSEPTATVGYRGVDAGQMDWEKPESMTIYPSAEDVNRHLQLVFGPDGQLRSWGKN